MNHVSPDWNRIERELERLIHTERPRYRRLWAYYRNPMRICTLTGDDGSPAGRPYRQAQEWGLPQRITGMRSGGEPFADHGARLAGRKEVVIENDIAWRVETMVDYLFGRPLVISSAAPESGRRDQIGRLLRLILAASGGIQFLQQLALLGTVYGFVDVAVKLNKEAESGGCGTSALGEAPAESQSSSDGYRTSEMRAAAEPAPPESRGTSEIDEDGRIAGANDATDARLERIARMIRLEIIEPARALPLLSCDDYRVMEGYGQVWEVEGKAEGGRQKVERAKWWEKLRGMFMVDQGSPARAKDVQVVELLLRDRWLRLENGKVVASGGSDLGEVPVVHIQNTAEAFEYSGASDVEPLIPLQDELNTRLSDRAHRISLQSFKMYLAKGVEQFNDQPVSPGRMWTSENENATITEFGGDAHCPSEDAHINDLREALDKTSGVTPIAAGAIKNRIGRLTSAAALRITLLALLSKTNKKRTLYGAGIERMCELALRWLDVAGIYRTLPEERRVELSWPSPLPENTAEKLAEAEIKLRLGVEAGVVLRELGY